ESRAGYQPQASSIGDFQKNLDAPNYCLLDGVIPLVSSSTANLCDQIEDYCTTTFGYDPARGPPQSSAPNVDELQLFYALYSRFRTQTLLSQGLSGFNAGLRQRV